MKTKSSVIAEKVLSAQSKENAYRRAQFTKLQLGGGVGAIDTYIGLTSTSFKDRWRNHRSNFKTRNPKNSTALSKHLWKLDDENVQYDVSWKIVSRAKPFNHVTGMCNLCIREKYFIIFKPEMASLNHRDEIAGPCLHKQKQLLKKSQSQYILSDQYLNPEARCDNYCVVLVSCLFVAMSLVICSLCNHMKLLVLQYMG